MHLQTYNPTHTAESLQTIFEDKYQLEDFEDRYFRYMDYENVVEFSKEEYREFMDILARGNAIFVKAYEFYRKDLVKNLPDFAFMEPFFAKKFPLGEYFLGRYDVIREAGTGIYKFLETNANTPGMITESCHVSKYLFPEGYHNSGADLRKYIQSIFARHPGKKIGILLPYSFEDEDFLTGLDYRDMIAEVAGMENVIVADIFESHIVEERYFTMKGEKIDVVLDFFPFEFFLTDLDFCENFFQISKLGSVTVYNPLESIVLQDKLIFAVVYENIEEYSQEEQDFIRKHIPFTTREFQEDSSKYLAKWRFGRYGREIYQEQFYSSIPNSKDFIFQQKIVPEKCDDKENFLVFGAYTNFQDGLALITRKQKKLTTADEDSRVTLVFVNPEEKSDGITL